MGKKILVLGTGAQGSTVAQRMDEELNVDEIICADADHKAVDELVKILKKAKGTYVDADDVDSIIDIIQERIDWMDRQGLYQWNKTHYMQRYPREYFLQRVMAGEFYLAAGDRPLCDDHVLPLSVGSELPQPQGI